jgi:hypothetical protein
MVERESPFLKICINGDFSVYFLGFSGVLGVLSSF